jgi:ABC-type transport system involved in cytochrome c biogenesis permease subunit
MSHASMLFPALAGGLYALAGLLYLSLWWRASRAVSALASATFALALLLNLFQLGLRWVQAGQPPFKTLYESLIVAAACVALIYLVLELAYRARLLGAPAALGAAVIMLIGLLQADREAVNLPPALQSHWFIPHVTVYFFGYASIFLAALVAAVYLVRPGPIGQARPDLTGGKPIELSAVFDGAVRFGFALLTAGMLMGAAWAKAAWGDYWVWDPKENWSLVTWLLFAAYLHLYYFHHWRGRRLAILTIAGFAAMAFTYLGMHLLPTAAQSIHVYQ